MTACQPFHFSDDAYVDTGGEVESLEQELTEAEADIVQISMRAAYGGNKYSLASAI